MTESKISLVNLAKWVESNWWFYAQHISPYIFAVLCAWLGASWPGLATIYTEAESWWLGIFCVVSQKPVYLSAIVLTVVIISTRKGYKYVEHLKNAASKEKERNRELLNEQLKYRQDLDDAEQHADFLRQKFHDLLTRGAASFLKRQTRDIDGFGDHTRVSLYAHGGKSFFLAGRYTEHPEYIKPNRQTFPDDEGCIGQAWRNGGQFFCTLPDPVADSEAYANTLKGSFRINKGSIKNFRMQSCCYYAKALMSDNMRIGVIVYESTRSDILIQEQLEEIVAKDEDHLIRIIEQAKFVNPLMTMQRGREE